MSELTVSPESGPYFLDTRTWLPCLRLFLNADKVYPCLTPLVFESRSTRQSLGRVFSDHPGTTLNVVQTPNLPTRHRHK